MQPRATLTLTFQEFTLANIIHASLKEQEASEQSARMNSMENATRNAGEMIDALTLQYNRFVAQIFLNLNLCSSFFSPKSYFLLRILTTAVKGLFSI